MRVLIVPDDEDAGAAAFDVTDVVRRLWSTHQGCIRDGMTPDGDDDPVFEKFRAFAGLPTQEEYEAERYRKFVAHTEWLERMKRTNWGMNPDTDGNESDAVSGG